jgi:hypothetical protein
MPSGRQNVKTFLMQKKNERKKKSMERKNAYLQAITHDDHCNGHDDDLVATKNHCTPMMTTLLQQKNRLNIVSPP